MSSQRASGERTAGFETLVAPVVEPALHLAYSMLGDRWEAEDAVQESITKAWRKLHQAREPSQFRAWFLAIVANQCRNVRRTHWFRTLRVRELRVAPSDPHPDHLDLERALDRLPPKDRQAIFLYFYLDLPIEEVATVLAISAAAAKGRIYRACRRMRPDLAEVII